MKKQRSLKSKSSSDVESLRPSIRRNQTQFKKHSADASKAAASAAQQKKGSAAETSNKSPNYMKHTSSSDAKREGLHLQVSPQCKKPSEGKNSKPPPAQSLKPGKALMRKSSLKAVRPPMKRSCGPILRPNPDVNRATCSSTLKDSNFPPYLDLHPGGTESEGTSAIKVCPYSFCSLNGYYHAPLPPLRRFLFERRRTIKTQKSSKLREAPGDILKEIDTGQRASDDLSLLQADSAVSAINPCSGFFVEIFMQPNGEADESAYLQHDERTIFNADEEPKHVFPESLTPTECSATDAEEDGERENQFDGNNLSQNSPLPAEEMDVDFDHADEIEHADCLGYRMKEDHSDIVSGIRAESDAKQQREVVQPRIEGGESVCDAIDMEWKHEEAPNSVDGTDRSILSDDPDHEIPDERRCDSNNSFETYEVIEETSSLEVHQENTRVAVATLFDGEAHGCGHAELDDINIGFEAGDHNDIKPEHEHHCDFFYGHAELKYGIKQVIFETGSQALESDAAADKRQASMDINSGNHQSGIDLESLNRNLLEDSDGFENQTSKAANSEIDYLAVEFQNNQEQLQGVDGRVAVEKKQGNGSINLFEYQNFELPEMGKGMCRDSAAAYANTENEGESIMQDKKSDREVVDLNSIALNQSIPTEIDGNQNSDMKQGNYEKHRKIGFPHSEECKDTEKCGFISAEGSCKPDHFIKFEDETVICAEEPCVTPNVTGISEKHVVIISENNNNEHLPYGNSNLKGKFRRLGKRSIENDEELMFFNPKAPRYLDPEADPEAEKVDLRHQMMDERKNAEEWMIDYALQQTVNKLAPARKRRVALLVEAFETIIPPKCEAHLRHSATSFTHSRPIQACS